MRHVPSDNSDPELVLLGGIERVGTGTKFNLRDSRLRRLRLLRKSGERQDCDR
jgi:hypothetical protein